VATWRLRRLAHGHEATCLSGGKEMLTRRIAGAAGCGVVVGVALGVALGRVLAVRAVRASMAKLEAASARRSASVAALAAKAGSELETASTMVAGEGRVKIHALEPESVVLASLPTRVAESVVIEVPSCDKEVVIDIKVDAETGAELSGNKVRKLEYLMADAVRSGATHVVTNGGAQSNFARATALAARRLGLTPLMLLRQPGPGSSIEAEEAKGNLLLMRLAGTRIGWMPRDLFSEPARRMEAMRALGAAEGARDTTYVVPQGGSNALGSWGYVRMVAELLNAEGGCRYKTLALAVGSGGSFAGVLLGRALLGLTDSLQVVGVPVCDDAAFFDKVIARIFDEFNAAHATQLVPGPYTLLDGYVGKGYGIAYPESMAVLASVARKAGLVLDPVYSSKALYGVVHAAATGKIALAEPACFVHTGGIYGTLAQGEGALAAANGRGQ